VKMPLPRRGKNVGGRNPSPKSVGGLSALCFGRFKLSKPHTAKLLGQESLDVFGIDGVNTTSTEKVLLEGHPRFFHHREEELHDLLASRILKGFHEQVKSEWPMGIPFPQWLAASISSKLPFDLSRKVSELTNAMRLITSSLLLSVGSPEYPGEDCEKRE
jgi:hypothetical protein